MSYELGGRPLMRIWAKHEPEPGHLRDVLEDMRRLGPPTIRCVRWRGELYAIEGSHRLKAAFELGLTPNVIAIEADRFFGEDENWLDWLKFVLPPYSWIVAFEKKE